MTEAAMGWAEWLVSAVAALLLSALAVGALGAWFWRRTSARQIRQLDGSRPRQSSRTVSFDELRGLPEPVARYLRRVLAEGRPLVRTARLAQTGALRVGRTEARGRWCPMTAVQHFSVAPAGFIWDARIRMAPLLRIFVRDGCVGGRGGMEARIWALVPMVRAQAGAALDTAALQRYLGEAVWLPTALLPSQGVAWQPIDEWRARATLEQGGVSASLEFRFGPDGDAVEVYAPARYREFSGRYLPTPWSVRLGQFAQRGGMRIPLQAEASWLLPGGRYPYWRGCVQSIHYSYGG
ncbi:MAG: hypothetical protein P8076_01840 [Gammaproteobacteria bacterium]